MEKYGAAGKLIDSVLISELAVLPKDTVGVPYA